jgi:hypothetical protein
VDDVPEDALLADVAPTFEKIVRDTFERNAAVDASLELTRNGEPQRAPEVRAGSVRRLRADI